MKKPEANERFGAKRKKLEVFLLPPSSPELNAVERLWLHRRMIATHNRAFDTKDELCNSLFDDFGDIPRKSWSSPRTAAPNSASPIEMGRSVPKRRQDVREALSQTELACAEFFPKWMTASRV